MINKYDIIDKNKVRVNSRHLQIIGFILRILLCKAKSLFVSDGFFALYAIIIMQEE